MSETNAEVSEAKEWPYKTIPTPTDLEIPILTKLAYDITALQKNGVTRYLERGHIKTSLIWYLAEGIWPQNKLAEFFRVEPSRISAFARRHKDEIEAVRKQMDEETQTVLQSLWVTRKDMRMSEYQQTLEDIEEIIFRDLMKGNRIDVSLVKAKFQALRNVAEELGDLPPRIAIQQNTTQVRYTLEGVNLDEL